MSIPANELVDATIRSELEQGDRTLASEHVLTRFTGHVLFERRWFAPRELVADCALDVIRLDPSIREEGQEALINTYRSQVIDEGRRIGLAHGAALKLRRGGDGNRIEVENAPAPLMASLKAAGCFTEIIQWRTRVFVPFDPAAREDSIAIIEKVLAILPVSGGERKTAVAA